MNKVSRRQSLQSLASLFMLGAAAGTAAYIKRDELADWLPAPRRPEWASSIMIMTTVHPEGITRGQATAMNSTKIKLLCDDLNIKYLKVQSSDDLTSKVGQYREMREMLEDKGPYSIVTVSDRGVVKIHSVPADIESMTNLVKGINR